MWADEYRPTYYEMSSALITKPISVRLPEEDLRRIPARNRSEFIRAAVAEKLARMEEAPVTAKRPTVRAMLALRQRFVAGGGELLDADGLAAELRRRRGGVA